jgi:hypothetical protein
MSLVYIFSLKWKDVIVGIPDRRNGTDNDAKHYNDTRVNDYTKTTIDALEHINVLILEIDSLSRFAAEHFLSNTIDLLTNQLGGVTFKRHNILGYNTSPNVRCVFHGQYSFADAEWFDQTKYTYPLVWQNFRDYSYKTGLAMDSYPDDKIWFKDEMELQPVDNFVGPGGYYIQKEHLTNGGCYKGLPTHLHHLDMVEQFWKTYKSDPKFYFSSLSVDAHDRVSHVVYLDQSLNKTLTRMKNNGDLDNTLLFVMADHGKQLSI